MKVPIFKSDASVGKSILTLEPAGSETPGGSDSIFTIAKEFKLEQVVLIEDSMTGLPKALKNSEKAGVDLAFGINLMACNNHESIQTSAHRIALLAKNRQGIEDLKRIFTMVHADGDGFISNEEVRSSLNGNLRLVIPFYDSFVWKNFHTFSNCIPDFLSDAWAFFIEDNGLPFDPFVAERAREVAKSFGVQTLDVKSIYYKKKDDYDAWVTYKIACSREESKEFWKNPCLANPGLNDCGSDEFCMECLS